MRHLCKGVQTVNEINHRQIMGIPFIGIITSELGLVDEVCDAFRPSLGCRQAAFEAVPFDQSDYYEPEMGGGLMRTWVCFEKLVDQTGLISLKHEAVKIEGRFLNEKGGRRINIDPGLLTLNNLILTTHKYSAHRLYLGDQVFAEITLLYQNRFFQPLPWTYQDYQLKSVLEFFAKVRNENKIRLNTGGG